MMSLPSLSEHAPGPAAGYTTQSALAEASAVGRVTIVRTEAMKDALREIGVDAMAKLVSRPRGGWRRVPPGLWVEPDRRAPHAEEAAVTGGLIGVECRRRLRGGAVLNE